LPEIPGQLFGDPDPSAGQSRCQTARREPAGGYRPLGKTRSGKGNPFAGDLQFGRFQLAGQDWLATGL